MQIIFSQVLFKITHNKISLYLSSHVPQSCLTQYNYEPSRVGPTQDGWAMVESSDRMCSTGERNGKPLQYSCLENPMDSMKRQKNRTLKDVFPSSVGAQYAT